MIETIIFDMGRVLIHFDFDRAYARMTGLSGLTTAEMRDRLRAAGVVHEYECGQIESRDFVKRVNEALGITLEFDEFREIWMSIFFEETLIPESFLEALRSRYRLVLLSNTNEMHYTMLEERFPILRHFDAYTLSYKVGAMKPERRIYADAVAKAGCAPARCFFTDDIPEYVEGARRFGIDAVQFQGFTALQAELRARGVAWD
ncbi:MAG: HAD family phosphatase [Bryobacteraceae bacterium]|nr:HAD family phosphatase [Bryobacteraceae bacterium]